MEQNMENVTRVLKAMITTTFATANSYERNNPKTAKVLRVEANALRQAVYVLTDPDYFKQLCGVYFPNDNESKN